MESCYGNKLPNEYESIWHSLWATQSCVAVCVCVCKGRIKQTLQKAMGWANDIAYTFEQSIQVEKEPKSKESYNGNACHIKHSPTLLLPYHYYNP